MNEDHKKVEHDQNKAQRQKKDYTLPISILVSSVIFAGAWIYTSGLKYEQGGAQVKSQTKAQTAASKFEEKIIPSAGVVLPVKWGNLGMRMVENGVIDFQKLNEVYAGRGGMGTAMKALLQKSDNGSLVITRQNSGEILNLLWAFGLANKNTILENGPMQDPRYGGAGRFASTGGWTISAGSPMDHYSAHQFVTLTAEQQVLVEKVAKNIYRPCCGNSVYFPDCNHGMAMLGLLELMAAQGATEEQMYKTALSVNSYWFPDTYLTIARYMQNNGIDWDSISAKTILGATYSSAQGYQRIQSLVAPEPSSNQSQGGCGVDAGQPVVQPQKQQSGCGV